jgi:hypothetical protein
MSTPTGASGNQAHRHEWDTLAALVAALATGAIATINSEVWLLAGALPLWRLRVATIASVVLVVAWLVIDGELWDHPDDDSPEARETSRLYNISTLVTLTAGPVSCFAQRADPTLAP